VTVLVPFPPGTVTDVVARLYSKHLSDEFGQPFLVVNRPGAGGSVATQSLLSAPADGRTLVFVSSAHASAPALNRKLPYDIKKDLRGVAMVGSTPTLIVVNPALGVRTLSELTALAGRKELSYGSAGVGSAAHLACEYFASAANLKLLHVPYKGSTEYVSETMAGRTDVACPPVLSAAALVNAGKLSAVAVNSLQRTPQLPTVPTMTEAGMKNFEFEIWYGLIAASRTPSEIIDQLANEIETASSTPEVRQALGKASIQPKLLKGQQFDTFIDKETQKYSDLVKQRGIEVN
jgi:tripartite-type tricarboxylate transporter receptor subunit TctC